jgi:hypothetical protein
MGWDEGERVDVAAAINGKKWYRLYWAWASVAGAAMGRWTLALGRSPARSERASDVAVVIVW